MSTRIRVYTASKLSEGPLWRRLAIQWGDEIEIVARWPFLHVTEDGSPRWPGNCAAHGAEFWRHNREDVAACDVLLLYGKFEHVLRGGLVEAGMALALGKVVIVVGENNGYGTWKFHSHVRRVETLDAARSLLKLMSMRREEAA